MNKAIGYIRISIKDQSNFSLPGQERYIRDFCEKNNIECLKIFEDHGRSAKNFDRPNWKALQQFVKENHKSVDILIVAKYDRFSRNVSESLQMIELLENTYGVKILSVMEPIMLHPKSPYFFQFRTQMLLGSQVEWLVIRDRTKSGIRQANISGRVVNRAPIGYKNARDEYNKPIIIIDDAKAQFIKKVFELFLQGIPPKAICRQLACEEFIIKGNGGIQRILSNSLYAGLIKAPAHYDDPEKLCKAIHEAIIPEADWWRVQSLLNNRQPQKKLLYNNNFSLRGFLEHDCGKILTAAFAQGKSKKIGYYRCMNDNKNLNANFLHGQMDEILKELSLPAFYVEYLHKTVLNGLHDNFIANKKMISEKKNELLQLYTKLDNIQDDRNNRLMDPQTHSKWHARYMGEKAILEAEIETMNQPISQALKQYEITLPLLSNMHFIYHQAETPQKHFILKAVFEQGLKHDGKTFRTPSIMDVFRVKVPSLQEKGLLIIEQPINKIEKTEECSPYETIIEPLTALLSIFSQIKVA